MSTSVKWISNDMRGAPTVNGTAGAMIAALDAFLITGWGGVTALSGSVSGGVATLLFSPGYSFNRDAVVLVSGATPSEVNGEARVLTSSNTSITFATTASDGAITGTIAVKYAPQGSWEKVFSATNKAVYRSTHVQSRRHYLRVDEAGTNTLRVRGFESMTDVDTGVGPFPTDSHLSGGGYWLKSSFNFSLPVRWRIFGDEQFFMVAVNTGANLGAGYTVAILRGFGDPINLAPEGDDWCTVLSYAESGGSNAGCLDSGSSVAVAGNGGAVALPRHFNGLGGAVICEAMSEVGNTGTAISGNDNFLGTAPSYVDGEIKMTRRFIRQHGTSNPPRAIIPGVHYIPQTGLTGLLSDGDVLPGAGALAGRRLLAINTGTSPNTSPIGVYLVDLTGPWR